MNPKEKTLSSTLEGCSKESKNKSNTEQVFPWLLPIEENMQHQGGKMIENPSRGNPQKGST